MEFKRGRLIDHLLLHTRDIDTSRRFYEAVLGPLGIPIESGEGYFFADEIMVMPGEKQSNVHLAFQAPDRETVDRVYRAGLDAGGRDNGKPGERSYHPGYYAAFLLDPDGNNVEAVHHGPAKRSTDAVVITPV